MRTTKFFLSAILSLALFASCSNDDDNNGGGEGNEEEVITDVTISFVNDANGTVEVTLFSEDPDGEDGPLVPVQTITGTFTAGATYTATVDIFNSIEMEDITEEITVDEPDEHFFIYGTDLDMTFARTATDVVGMGGNRIGFETSWTANTAGTGNLTIQLFHQSTMVDDTANDGLGSQEGGSTDIDITFTGVEIQ